MIFNSNFFNSQGGFYSTGQLRFIGTFSADSNTIPFSRAVGEAIDDTPETVWSALENLDVETSDELRAGIDGLGERSKLYLLHSFLDGINVDDKVALLESFPLKIVLKFAVEDALSSRHTNIDSEVAKFIQGKSETNPEEFSEASNAVISDSEVIDLAHERKVAPKPSATYALKAFNQKADNVNELKMPDVIEAFKKEGSLEEYSGQNLVDEMVLKVIAAAYNEVDNAFFRGSPEEIDALRAATSEFVR